METSISTDIKNLKKLGERIYSFSPLLEIGTFIIELTQKEDFIKFLCKKEFTLNVYEKSYSFSELRNFKFFTFFDHLDEIFTALIDKINRSDFKFLQKSGGVEFLFDFQLAQKYFPVKIELSENSLDETNKIDRLIETFFEVQKENEKLNEKINERDHAIVMLNDKIIKLENILNLQTSEGFQQLSDKICKLELEVRSLKLESHMPFPSKILKHKNIHFLENCLGKNISCLELIFDSDIDGDTSSKFHQKCDSQGPTIIFIKTTTGRRFGGYTSIDWDTSNSYKGDENSTSFLFSLSNNKKIINDSYRQDSIWTGNNYGPIFGNGYDLCVSNYFKVTESTSCLKSAYGANDHSICPYYLNGTNFFYITNLEVYKVN
jgi:hypothetical protein